MPFPGQDVYIIDDQVAGDATSTTDSLFLLSTNGPATPAKKTAPDTGNATLDGWIRAAFLEGVTDLYVQGYAASAGALPDMPGALALLPAGPGQVVAPEVVTSSAQIAMIPPIWAQGKVALTNGASGATDSALSTLAAAVIAGCDARGAGIFGDWLNYNDPLSGVAITAPMSIAAAGWIAKNDRLTGNPNLMAAGKRGQSVAVSIVGATRRSDAAMATLATAQVNTMRIVPGKGIRGYGFRSLADLTKLPQWKFLSGSRLIMDWRSIAADINEDFVFEQIDGQRHLLDRYQGQLKAAAKVLYDNDALYGKTPEDAYTVDVSDSLNPTTNLAQGIVTSTTRLHVSSGVEHVIQNVINRPLTADL